MQLSIKYTELAEEIKKRTGREIELEYVSEDTFKLSKPIKVPLFGTAKMSIDIKVIGFDNMILEVKAASNGISNLMSLMPTFDVSKYVIIEKDVVKILLDNIEQLRTVFTYIQPAKLSFDNENVILDFTTI